MRSDHVQELFESILPFDYIEERAVALGIQKRNRLFAPARMVLSRVLNGGTAESGRLAAAMREYVRGGGTEVVRGAFYQGFDEELLALMEELVTRAQTHVLAMPKSLPGVLAGPTDWRAVDSSTVKLPKALAEVYPGAGAYAALKVHAEI
ncbi:MAG: hypothetical protein GWP91_23960 [Rhodobacterales bacterium]|nr:hypothetical protein [Rhodobacterales bacterium]